MGPSLAQLEEHCWPRISSESILLTTSFFAAVWTLRLPQCCMQINSNTDGFVDSEEFVAAALHLNQLEEHDSEKWQQRSRAAFEKFDIDGDGFITAEELRMHTGLKGSIEPLREEADIDNDGKISFHEFRRLLKTVSIKSRNVRNPPGYLSFWKV